MSHYTYLSLAGICFFFCVRAAFDRRRDVGLRVVASLILSVAGWTLLSLA